MQAGFLCFLSARTQLPTNNLVKVIQNIHGSVSVSLQSYPCPPQLHNTIEILVPHALQTRLNNKGYQNCIN